MDLSIITNNLLAPPILFFALGLFAALVRSDLSIPQSIAKIMSLYLMMAIGFKGGVAAVENGLGADLVVVILLGITLSAVIPFIAYGFLRTFTGLARIDRAAVAAHYGSISIVTFVAAITTLDTLGIAYSGHMVAAAAAMEAPAILAALYLANRKSDKDKANSMHSSIGREIIFNSSIVLLLGSFLIGMITGPKGYQEIAGFLNVPFKGILCLFLLDMGLIAGRELRQIKSEFKIPLIFFGVYMPFVGGFVGGLAAKLLGFSTGDIVLISILSASASYIAVPAAMRIALPEAKPSIYLTLSLAITFPINISIGIPTYITIASML
ncbi:sodium-dependent bicarbonate transport family permease [Curvivirga aplysinae]|uniref:sodium-dependent bicarbonate transport family permease n=1 Tax=Curvivirga aplysinae TaxID=2529852 RepID=UPI0012BC9EE6|nr:sodium-dependent bicarbonate transport family permease [Curvivirga aplysinae]MTI08867.1 sodium-dependent bicarbonate transport family permease [Curvivirga aplysinae]